MESLSRITPDIVDFQTLCRQFKLAAGRWSMTKMTCWRLSMTVHDPWIHSSPEVQHFTQYYDIIAIIGHWISYGIIIIFGPIIDGIIGILCYHWIWLDIIGPRIDLVIRHQHEFPAHSAAVLVWSNPASWKKLRGSSGTLQWLYIIRRAHTHTHTLTLTLTHTHTHTCMFADICIQLYISV